MGKQIPKSESKRKMKWEGAMPNENWQPEWPVNCGQRWRTMVNGRNMEDMQQQRIVIACRNAAKDVTMSWLGCAIGQPNFFIFIFKFRPSKLGH